MLEPGAQLPGIRSDLKLAPNVNDIDGSRQWLLVDPVRQLYFELDKRSADIFNVWSSLPVGSTAAQVLQNLNTKESSSVGLDDISELMRFLVAHELVQATASRALNERRLANRQGRFKWLLLNYLFFRVPLVRPDRFLHCTLPLVSLFYTRIWWFLVGILFFAGGYLTIRQWDDFVNTFVYFTSLDGLFYYAVSLVAVKAFHELGHGYTATRYGCRIPTMGIAFLVMFPVLYTDTTESWKVLSRRKRMLIDAAGIVTELMIAVLATTAWVFLQDGPLRSAMFFIATTSWVSSLLINASPFMKFDGYHLLTDITGVRNLQDRGFEVGRWRLREILYGFRIPPPESLDTRYLRLLTVYAWSTWVYRFFLFLGIALLIYHFAFKALAIVLFTVEIYWFIGRPILRELTTQFKLVRENNMNGHSITTFTVLLLAGIAVVYPWQSTVTAPVLLEANSHHQVFTAQSGQVMDVVVSSGDAVNEGDVLLRLHDPEIDRKLYMEKLKKLTLESRLNRIAAYAKDRALLQVLSEQLQESESRIKALQDQVAGQMLLAPTNGVVVEIEPDLHPGRWMGDGYPVATIARQGTGRARGYLSAEDVARVNPGMQARFVHDDLLSSAMDSEVAVIAASATEVLELEPLASVRGGAVPSNSVDQQLVPIDAWYSIELDVETGAQFVTATQTGVVHIEAQPQSLLSRVAARTLQVLVRESGF